ncbi:lipase family protein [Acidocella facilis]|uniref:lipase family protein n=1 Tax=Acidocella facilis TaxID=525 RepID=UPI001F441666|nr:hypothetical protein [Acidocella facilis]
MPGVDNQTYIHASRLAYIDKAGDYVKTVLPGYKLESMIGTDKPDGFRALVLSGAGGVIVAFRGTVLDFHKLSDRALRLLSDSEIAGIAYPALPPSISNRINDDVNNFVQDVTLNDLKNDLGIFNGATVQQFEDGVQLVQALKVEYQNMPITVTGHSLGGGIANFVAGELTGLAGVAFAAPGYKGYRQASGAKIINYANVNDTIAMVNCAAHCGAILYCWIAFTARSRSSMSWALAAAPYGVSTPRLTSARLSRPTRTGSTPRI